MARIDRPGAVKLLYQQHPGKRMRQGQVRQADAFVRGLPECGVEPVRPADYKGYIVAFNLPSLEFFSQRQGSECGAALIQRDDAAALGNDGFDACALGGIQRVQGL